MKKISVFLVCLLSMSIGYAQSCGCSYANQLRPSGHYSYYNDFNCYQYVRAKFAGYHYGDWIPLANNSIGSTFSPNVISEANDPGVFEEVCDPADAHVIVYNCGHAAAVLSGGTCFIEKVGFGAELRKYGLNYGSCLPNAGTKFYKYLNSWPYRGINMNHCGYNYCEPPPPPPPPICAQQAVWYGTSTVLNTFNYTSNYFNQILADCEAADNFTWQKTNGTDVYNSCFSSCQGLYFYLNTGQSATYRVTAKQGSTTLFVKDYTFSRSSGGWWLNADNQQPEGTATMARFMQNRLENLTDSGLDVQVYNMLGQRLYQLQIGALATERLQAPRSNVYLVLVTRLSDGAEESHKVYLEEGGMSSY